MGDPTGQAPDPETILTVADPGYWSAQTRELQEVLTLASGGTSERARKGGLGRERSPRAGNV